MRRIGSRSGLQRAERSSGLDCRRDGWRGISNGDLLDRAEVDGFQVLIVADKNFQYQQNLKGRRIAILELWTNHRPTLEKHFERIRTAVESAAAGQFAVLNEKS